MAKRILLGSTPPGGVGVVGDEVVLSADEVERLWPVLDYASAECGADTAAAAAGARAIIEERGAAAYAYGDLLSLKDVLEEVQADRCPVDQELVELLLAKF
jgi:hypothetical protein